MFFIPCDKWETFFLKASCCYFHIFSSTILLFSFKLWNVLKEVGILHYLYNNDTVLIPKFQNEAILYYVYTQWTFVANLFYDNVFDTYFLTVAHFSWKMSSFKKT